MPKELYIPEDHSNSGIKITWTKTAGRLDLFGWYDTYVGITGESFMLRDFFDKLGITKKDCDRAFKEK